MNVPQERGLIRRDLLLKCMRENSRGNHSITEKAVQCNIVSEITSLTTHQECMLCLPICGTFYFGAAFNSVCWLGLFWNHVGGVRVTLGCTSWRGSFLYVKGWLKDCCGQESEETIEGSVGIGWSFISWTVSFIWHPFSTLKFLPLLLQTAMPLDTDIHFELLMEWYWTIRW